VPSFPGLTARLVPAPAFAAKLDLALNVVDDGSSLLLDLDVDADRSSEQAAEALADRFVAWLETVVAAPDAALSLQPLANDEERRVLAAWGAPRAEYPHDVLVHDLIAEQAARAPDAPALVHGEQVVSYVELLRDADSVARGLAARGIGPEDRVAVCLADPIAFVTTILGVLRAGAAYVPLDPSHPPSRRAQIAEGAALLVVDEVLGELRREQREPRAAVPENLAYVIYTSGSTGEPKGVEVAHASLAPLLLWGRESLQLEPGERTLQQFAPAFDGASWSILVSLVSGACLVLATRDELADPRVVVDLLRRERIESIQGTPPQHGLLADAADELLPALRAVHAGADVLTATLVERVRARLGPVRVTNMYGPTETTVISVFHDLAAGEAPQAAAIPIGRPAANARLHVLDGELQPVPPGAVGELYVGGGSVARGYAGRPALTADRFVPDPYGEPGARLYRTGDLVRFGADGVLELLGREDDQVKVAGVRLEPAEVETALRRHAAVRDAVVVARPDARGRLRLDAYAVASAAPDEVRSYLRGAVPPHAQPATITLLEALPLTGNGKVDRRALPEPDRATRAYASPVGEIEEAIATRFAEVFELVRVGADDDFFSLGGDSLDAASTVTWARERFGVDLPLRALFDGPTVRELAAAIELGGEGVPLLPPIARVSRAERRVARSEVLDA
jgi:amino acid adenylation domain-containing protein